MVLVSNHPGFGKVSVSLVGKSDAHEWINNPFFDVPFDGMIRSFGFLKDGPLYNILH